MNAFDIHTQMETIEKLLQIENETKARAFINLLNAIIDQRLAEQYKDYKQCQCGRVQ